MQLIIILKNVFFIFFIIFFALALKELIKLIRTFWGRDNVSKDEYHFKSIKFVIYQLIMGLAGFLYNFLKDSL
ncbi:hypothetical protein [Bacillus sp. B-jedd]|uniref:hypothetical protein n=1 Tax=Bacillus sp. B-jedd TaxID=1476857 RepID=UPI0005156D56|nr:hypothetical protein [Bacillus sp. B-jedd]CEG28841.1 hypothetical protein BN1002_03765 [Bacillus sp. B-jedd]